MDTQAVHIPTLDPRISLAYKNRTFVADQVFPIASTAKLGGKFAHYSKEAFRAVTDALDESGIPRTITLHMEPYESFECYGHGVKVMLSDDTRTNSDNPAEQDIIHREYVQGVIALGREIEAVNLINTTNIANNTTLSGTSQWGPNGYANSNPISDIRAQIRGIQKRVPGLTRKDLRLLLPATVFDALVDHPTVRDYVKYTQNLLDEAIEPNNLASALKIGGVVIAENVKLTSDRGAADALDWTWPGAAGASMALLYQTTGTPSPLTPNFGYTFRSRIGYFPLREKYDKLARGTWMISEEKRSTMLTEPNAAFLWENPI